MCQMRIILEHDGGREVVLENAALLEVTDKGILVNALFEQPKLISDAAVGDIDFLKNEVTLVRTSRKVGHGTQNDN